MRNLKYFLSDLPENFWTVCFWAGMCVFVVVSSKEITKDKMDSVRKSMEKEAVFAGHAEWIAGTNGEPVFSWKDCK